MGKFKKLTHVLAVAAVAVVGFVVSPAGQAVVKQYPWASAISGAILAVAAIYHVPLNQ
ncbi:MAG TPA: hypothetical protein VLY23_18470 [Candidatus Acidoferrum sp.]|nr:hypothetical protein [Candidatus Acidoferrum sp.]